MIMLLRIALWNPYKRINPDTTHQEPSPKFKYADYYNLLFIILL